MDTLEQRITLLENKVKGLTALGFTTPLPIASGGTNATDAATALSNLGGQPVDADLTAFAALDGTAGLLAKTAAATFARRTLTAGANISIGNGDGQAGDPTVAVTGIGTSIQAWDADLDALAALPATAGYLSRTGAGAFAARTLTAGANISISNTTGAAADPTIAVTGIGSTIEAWDADLDAFAALDATAGLIAKTGAATYARRTVTGPAAGITVANGDGSAGNPTLALANDLSALEAMSGTGIVARTASETYAQRTITAGTGISMANGDGVSGNPTITCTVTGGYTDGSTIKAAAGSVSAPGITFNATTVTDNGLYALGTDNYAFSVNGAKALEFDSTGSMLSPLQTAWVATQASATDVTGDGTDYVLASLTEITDRNADLNNTTGIMTAPLTGDYFLNSGARLSGLLVGHTSLTATLITSNRNYQIAYCNPTVEALSGLFFFGGSVLADMDAADTAKMSFNVGGSTKTVDIDGAYFTGFLRG